MPDYSFHPDAISYTFPINGLSYSVHRHSHKRQRWDDNGQAFWADSVSFSFSRNGQEITRTLSADPQTVYRAIAEAEGYVSPWPSSPRD